jgi:hypothetical protein
VHWKSKLEIFIRNLNNVKTIPDIESTGKQGLILYYGPMGSPGPMDYVNLCVWKACKLFEFPEISRVKATLIAI